MKAYIGPYLNYFGPYQIAELLRYIGVSEKTCDDIGAYLDKTWVKTVCDWFESKRKRTVRIKLHKYDSWNAEHTIALIAVPVLKQLRSKKQSAGFTEDADAPEHLRSTAPNCKKPGDEGYDEHVDSNFFDRWFWILDEIIWSLEQVIADDDYDDNIQDYKVRSERIANGLRLFGKYFTQLWD